MSCPRATPGTIGLRKMPSRPIPLLQRLQRYPPAWTCARTTRGDQGFGYATGACINAGFFNESYGITL